MIEYDFVVVGGGSAGFAGARSAAALGLKTAVIEGAGELGGLCILRGCMPSKALLESAKRFRAIRNAAKFGLSAGTPSFDPGAIIARKRSLIAEFAGYRGAQLQNGPFDLLRGTAEFTGPHSMTVQLADGADVLLRAKSILIATGSAQSVPPIPGLSEATPLTSDDLLDRESIPDSLIVLGGGPVALEMASYCRAFGAGVTIIQRSPQILRGTDRDCAEALADGLRQDGIKVVTGTKLLRVEVSGTKKRVFYLKDGAEAAATGSEILNALGRHAMIPTGLPVRLQDGKIEVNLSQQTSLPHIFAAGDVCSPLEVVHVAIQQGEVAARNAARLLSASREPLESMDYRLNLFAVFTEPGFACVGASENELSTSEIPFATARYPFDDHGKSLVMGETHGFVKLIAHARSGEILGASIVGPEAAELIHEIVVAMRFHATAADLASIPHYHPTLSEIWTYPAEELAITK
ncbi:MAG: NAD(P)/FAD-dependent oxidoreductase [Verrucomicrobiaceae bacterium]|nr:MAG: NAD(P)/FAD-dependent oxidoreductase [Verrucomicrobiaceae bacterium]